MASNFIPMLSASPPPLDDTGSVDDDDEDFHDFLSASKVLDSPSESPIKTPDSTPSKTNLPKEKTVEINKSEEDIFLNVQSNKDVLDISMNDFQTISSHNENESPELNSSKEFTEFYTCSSKTTDDDLDFNIPQLEQSNGFSEDEFESVETVSKSECETEKLNFEINVKNVLCQPPEKDMIPNFDFDDKEVDHPEESDYEISCDKTENIPNEVEPQSIENYDDNVDDDFADFETAAFAKEEIFKGTGFVEEKDESFANFATASFDPDEMNQSFSEFESAGDNQWADFTTGTSPDEVSEIINNLPSQPSSVQSLQIFATAFPLSNENSPESQEATLKNLSESLKSSGEIWPRLEDLDQSLSLRHQWIGSEAFQKTLQSLNIDSRNILRNPSIPLFALGLGPLLEPVKVDTGLEESASSNKPSSPKLEPQENFIPPAQFDWNSSGLVNPLDPTQASSSLLDLDFFNADYASTSKSVAKTFSLEEELLGHDSKFDICSLQSRNPPSQQNILLEQLMSNIKLTNSTVPPNRKRSENLSEGAIQILKRIPDLSFVKAKVLMFPVHSDEVS